MNRWTTILLLLLAAAAAVFLFVFEPRMKSSRLDEATREFVLNFDPQAITGVRMTSGNDIFELTRHDDGWWVGPKPKDVASPKEVSDLFKALVDLHAFDIIHAGDLGSGRDLDDLGLEKPRSQIELFGPGGGVLYFGKEAAAEGRMYVRRADSKDAYIVSDALQQIAFRNPQEFRDRRLTSLTPDRIDKFTIKRGLGEIALERDGTGWEIVRPLRARADESAVNKLLGSLLGLQILDFVADESNDLGAYGVAEPRAELILTSDDDARPIALRIGADAGAKGVVGQFTARHSVYHLPSDAWKLLQVNPDDLRDRQVANLNLDTVDAIRLKNGSTAWTIERAGDDWKSNGHVVEDKDVQKLATALGGAKVLDYLPLTQENLSKTGLDSPAGLVAFDALLSENTPETTAGRHPVVSLSIGKRDGDKAYVRVDDAPEICVVPATALDAIPAGPPQK